MTCIIAYVNDDIIYMLSDSCGSTQSSRNRYKQQKVFKIHDNLIIGFCDSFRNGQNIFFSKKLKNLKREMKESTPAFVFNKVIPKLKEILEADEYTETNDSEFIIGAYGRIFVVNGEDFSMLEPVDNFITIGCGGDIVSGILNYVDKDEFNLDIENNLIKIAKIVEKYFLGVQEPYHIIKGK